MDHLGIAFELLQDGFFVEQGVDDDVVLRIHVDHGFQVLAETDETVVFALGPNVLILDLGKFDIVERRCLLDVVEMRVHGGKVEVVDLAAVHDDFVVDHFVLQVIDSDSVVFVERSDV